jgi:glycosyltransferase involved in cell wall biosynthesis
MNDNPVFHELWGDSAAYFQRNDSADLARVVGSLRADPELREECADRSYQRARERFTAQRMVEQYESVYNEICSQARVA